MSQRRQQRPDSGISPVQLPRKRTTPLRQVTIRVVGSVIVMLLVALCVWIDRAGYSDNTVQDGITFLDAVYYSSVSLSTTGYGDITPVSEFARFFNVIVITPLRILFLALLVGTTLEVLTERSRALVRENRWRQTMLAHTVIVGYGVKGRAAAQSLVDAGTRPDQIVVIDLTPDAVRRATDDGFAGVLGDATRTEILDKAEIRRAAKVVVATNDDARSVLVTLTVRQLNRTATVVASVREAENAVLLTQSGADSVITSAEAAGNILGIAVRDPNLGRVVEDLLESRAGLELVEREVASDEVGKSPASLRESVMGVVRGGVVYRYDEAAVSELRRDDLVVVARSVANTDRKLA